LIAVYPCHVWNDLFMTVYVWLFVFKTIMSDRCFLDKV
jgi:hypothetical protein